MERAELLEALVELAREAGLELRRAPAAGHGDALAPRSGLCRLRERWILVLLDSEPLEDRIEVVVGALREQAADFLDRRYLPPALRERLELE